MANTKRALQLTLAVLKPDVLAHPHIAKEIKGLVLREGFHFVRSKQLHLSRSKAEEFYKEHEGRFFHNRLVTFMSSGPVSAHVLARDNAIDHWRGLMGPTKVFRTIYDAPDSIRGRFGLSDTRNCTHGSDSLETALREISFFFPEFDFERWVEEERIHFEDGKVQFDPEQDCHLIVDPKFSVRNS